MPLIRDTIQTEPLPCPVGKERIDNDAVRGLGSNADQPRNEQIAIGGVIIILASLPAAFGCGPCAVFPIFEPCP